MLGLAPLFAQKAYRINGLYGETGRIRHEVRLGKKFWGLRVAVVEESRAFLQLIFMCFENSVMGFSVKTFIEALGFKNQLLGVKFKVKSLKSSSL